jgi:hypothetical protein
MAAARYGADVNDPGKILIIGNYENTKPVEVAEASRMLRPLQVIDYDSILQLFLIGKNVSAIETQNAGRTAI